MDLNPDIFRQYDVRGRVGIDLTDETVSTLGRAMGSYLCQLGATKISVASDNRLSSDKYRAMICDEISKSGIHVLDFGVIPTPVFYYTLFEFGVDGGIMVTGSHNPPDFNGFKIAAGNSTIYGEEIQRIRSIAEKGQYTVGKGSIREADARGPYIERVLGDISIDRNLRVAADCGNGTAGLIVPDLFSAYDMSCKYLYCEPDGRFPNHHPDPTVPAYLEDLIAAVKDETLDVGIAYDGDADRIGVIDETGGIIWGDRLLIILARDIISRNRQARVIFEVKCSQALPEMIEAAGGVPIMWKTGHSLIKSKMIAEGALLAGEMSGHIFFNDRYYGYDDAMYASLRLLEILSRQQGSLSSLLADVPEYFTTPEIRVECPDSMKFKVVEDLKRHLQPQHRIIDIDGIRVVFDDGWGLIRASNTQPVLVLRFEARSKERLMAIKQDLMGALGKVAGRHVGLPGGGS